ncbi:MAG: hypothetical protein H6983_23715 [Ectothiorhodospiraceae bacterium]|nr:hypothetical protein [Chromatiales bacterium]MCP5157205.1 hypothetical protein [Ectothiorhodospiraceae bacterium]
MHDQRIRFLDRPENVRRLLRVFYVVCLGLIAADLVYHRHVSHPLESMPGFYGVYGFVACVLLVLVAKQMRRLLMRDEHYYDRRDGGQ